MVEGQGKCDKGSLWQESKSDSYVHNMKDSDGANVVRWRLIEGTPCPHFLLLLFPPSTKCPIFSLLCENDVLTSPKDSKNWSPHFIPLHSSHNNSLFASLHYSYFTSYHNQTMIFLSLVQLHLFLSFPFVN